jgi:Methylase involved in ubiquinone/menaquinone biosynthesis
MTPTGERFIPSQTGIIEIEHLNRYYFVINQIDLREKTVLDIASGEGYGSNILARHAKKVIGVDISEEAINHAKNKYQSEKLKFIQGNATSIPLPDNSFDVVVSFETIEHHNRHEEMMHELNRVLKDNGILIISSPDKYYYSDLPKHKNQFHIKELYYEEFKILISEHFKHAKFYSQRVFAGSLIFLDEKSQTYSKPIVIDEEGNSSAITPVYNIAICSQNMEFKPQTQVVLYKHFENIITYADIDVAHQTGITIGMQVIRASKAYRLGKFLLKPFSLIRNISSTT